MTNFCHKRLPYLALLLLVCLPVTVLQAKDGKSSTVPSTSPQVEVPITPLQGEEGNSSTAISAPPQAELPVTGQQPKEGKSSPVLNAPPYVELLIAQPPKDWKRVFQANLGDTRVADYVPKGESKDEWTAKLSFESYKSLLNSDPLLVIKSQIDDDKKHCDFVKDFSLFAGQENKYDTAMKLITCGKRKSTGKGRVSLFKAIKGEQYFYVIRLVRILPPFKPGEAKFSKRDMAGWSHYFGKIKVCDPGSKDHPCPKPAKH